MRKSLPTNTPYQYFHYSILPTVELHLQAGYARAESHLRHPTLDLFKGRNPLEDFAFFEAFDLPELLRATAWRTSALKADLSASSPSWKSIARRTFPTRLELKRRAGSFSEA